MAATYFSTASSPRPVSRNRSPSMPLVWVSRWRTVTVRLTSSSRTRKSGRYVATGASSSTTPSSTSCITSVAVNTFEMEPIWKTLSVVAGCFERRLSTPEAAATVSSPCAIARVAPTTPCLSASAFSRSCQCETSTVVLPFLVRSTTTVAPPAGVRFVHPAQAGRTSSCSATRGRVRR